MDPNRNWQEQLQVARQIQKDYDDENGNGVDQDDANRLADLVLSMALWLERGGFAPDWTKRR